MTLHDMKLEISILLMVIAHLFLPAWFYLVPEIAFSATWYWGTFLAGGGGTVIFETITFTEGTTATVLIVASFVLLLPTVIYTKGKKGTETKVQAIFIGIIWMISGVLLMAASIIYLSAFGGLFERFFTNEFYNALGIVFTIFLAIATFVIGLVSIIFANIESQQKK